jgi:putative DNA primase/helicase
MRGWSGYAAGSETKAPVRGHQGFQNDRLDSVESYQSTEVIPVLDAPELRAQSSTKQDARRLRKSTASAKQRAKNGGDPTTEHAIACALARKYANQLLYDHTRGRWLRWDGSLWRSDEVRGVFFLLRSLAQEVGLEAARAAVRLGSAAFIGGAEKIAKADPAFAVTHEDLDRDPWLLGTPGGTVDLRTGELRVARPNDRITKSTAVAPAERVDCPLWLRFLEEATGGDMDLVEFLQRWFGYALSADTREEQLLFIYGPGGRGKGTLVNTIGAVMGDYRVNAPMDTFTASTLNRHPADLAMMCNARLVTASETEKGHTWAESKIKQLTGNDPITARFMRQNFFTYRAAFKLTFQGNHRPKLRSVDDAARRRFNIVPFTQQPTQKDKQLKAKLRAEWPGILRWAIDGCLDWQRNGLQQPAIVREATEEYFSDEDNLARWFEQAVERGPNRECRSIDLYESYKSFARAEGVEPDSHMGFSMELRDRFSLEAKRTATGMVYRGLALREIGRQWM